MSEMHTSPKRKDSFEITAMTIFFHLKIRTEPNTVSYTVRPSIQLKMLAERTSSPRTQPQVKVAPSHTIRFLTLISVMLLPSLETLLAEAELVTLSNSSALDWVQPKLEFRQKNVQHRRKLTTLMNRTGEYDEFQGFNLLPFTSWGCPQEEYPIAKV